MSSFPQVDQACPIRDLDSLIRPFLRYQADQAQRSVGVRRAGISVILARETDRLSGDRFLKRVAPA